MKANIICGQLSDKLPHCVRWLLADKLQSMSDERLEVFAKDSAMLKLKSPNVAIILAVCFGVERLYYGTYAAGAIKLVLLALSVLCLIAGLAGDTGARGLVLVLWPVFLAWLVGDVFVAASNTRRANWKMIEPLLMR